MIALLFISNFANTVCYDLDIMGQVVFGYNFNAVKASTPSEAPIYQAFKTVIKIFGQQYIFIFH